MSAEAAFQLAIAANRRGPQSENLPYGLDLSFLSRNPAKPYLFFERTRAMLDVVSHEWPTGVRRSIAELELTYYLPCSARGRIIAYLGVSRTESGDFLSSDDVELLVTLSGYVGIAVDNAMLYQSLARKADEYERLKEYSRKYRRIHQRRHPRGRSGGPRRKLELASGETHRHLAFPLRSEGL